MLDLTKEIAQADGVEIENTTLVYEFMFVEAADVEKTAAEIREQAEASVLPEPYLPEKAPSLAAYESGTDTRLRAMLHSGPL